MRVLKSAAGIRNSYARRILSNIAGKDPFRIYSGTPRALEQLVRGLSGPELRLTTRERAWSIAQILHHLADSELAMGFRYRMALAQSGSSLQMFDEERWARHLRYAASDPAGKLALFGALRRDHVRMLRALTPGDWRRVGIHEERGKESVERMMQMMAGHDLNHRRQIAELRSYALRRANR